MINTILINIIGWMFVIAGYILSLKWFKNEGYMYKARMICSAVATIIFLTQLFIHWF